MKIEGKYTDADIKIDTVEESCIEQIEEMINHKAFSNPVKIMPDTHSGKGSVIGFTMPLSDKVIPNTVGVDIGCGMYAVNIGQIEITDFEKLDQLIRDKVPFGFNVHKLTDYHLQEDFPHTEVRETINNFSKKWYDLLEQRDGGYSGIRSITLEGNDYFNKLSDKVGISLSKTINSVGTLGGGNHFIEIARSEQTRDIWVIIHSGSRGIGAKTAAYHQEKARKFHREVDQKEYNKEIERIKKEYSGKEIEQHISELKREVYVDWSKDYDYLSIDDAYDYLVDMIYCQRYASESRKQMAKAVIEALNEIGASCEVVDEIESIHNYIDFEDMIIRKGACPARKGQKIIVPFNMRDGTLVAVGKGNPDWNYSSPHGAGRIMSRTQAFNELDINRFKDTMKDVFSTSVSEKTLDESPFAYKDSAIIEEAIKETATIVDRLVPIHNLKAD